MNYGNVDLEIANVTTHPPHETKMNQVKLKEIINKSKKE
jgi:hypothetical protein